MGNDMTWEQKCRISALRAACASAMSLDVVDDLTEETGRRWNTDEEMTRRILARAEAFRIALLSNGALNYTPDDDEAPEASMELSNCKYCAQAIGKHDDGTWIDNTGTRYCGSAQTLMHAPSPERKMPESNVCTGCGSTRKDTPLMIGDGLGCEHKWHQNDRVYGNPTIEPIVHELCPGCGSLAGPRLVDVDSGGRVYCDHKWHQL